MKLNEIETKAKDLQRELERLRSEQIRHEERRKLLDKEHALVLKEITDLGLDIPRDAAGLATYIETLEKELEDEIDSLKKLIADQGSNPETR